MLHNAYPRAAVLVAALLLVLLGTQPDDSWAQQGRQDKEEEEDGRAPSIDANTGKVLNEVMALLDAENYNEARRLIGTLKPDRLSPYERSRVEQILASIENSLENYPAAQEHLRQAIAAGGLNEVEISQARYQIAQMFLAEEKWAEGAAALEEWFKTAQNPNSAAYYLLAVSYYQMEDYKRALPPAQKAIELSEAPKESWLQLVLALHLQSEQYRESVPLLERLIGMNPQNKTYWQQLSSIHTQLEDFPRALAILQAAYAAGIANGDEDIRRLADLLMYNGVPNRGAVMLEKAMEAKQVKGDVKAYEKLANSWLAAGEYQKATKPLQRAAELAENGDMFVRLGEVHIQREQWSDAATALKRGIDKGKLKDTDNAELLMGISLYNQKELAEARRWFQRVVDSGQHGKIARSYLQAIDVELGP